MVTPPGRCPAAGWGTSRGDARATRPNCSRDSIRRLPTQCWIGRSSGSPQWAALAAITAQLNHARLGNINPTLYQLPPAVFHDITSGNNAFGDVPGFTAGSGWDPMTGLGTPKASEVAVNLAARI